MWTIFLLPFLFVVDNFTLTGLPNRVMWTFFGPPSPCGPHGLCMIFAIIVVTCDGQKDVINLFSLSISPLAQSSKPGI